MPLQNQSWQRRGFTLVDSILMMLVVGIGMAGLMAYFTSVNQQMLDGDMTVKASVLAQEKMDQVIADKMYQGYNTILNANYPQEALVGDFTGFTRTTAIQEVDPNDLITPLAGSGLKRINITVGWGNAAAQQITVTTLVTTY
ncbi:MAG: type II secretion system protein [Deltaproteobacteria bacterium]|nr:type II secretion system protein [Deltaproteobacteria bacterium]